MRSSGLYPSSGFFAWAGVKPASGGGAVPASGFSGSVDGEGVIAGCDADSEGGAADTVLSVTGLVLQDASARAEARRKILNCTRIEALVRR